VLGSGTNNGINAGDLPPVSDPKGSTDIKDTTEKTAHGHDTVVAAPHDTAASGKRANAAFVILARNSDLKGVIPSVKQMEDRFNKQYKYPYVFLNEEPFEDKFKACVFSSSVSSFFSLLCPLVLVVLAF
jgi:hypothetical protein